MRSISGSTASARAKPTLCCIPPLNSPAKASSHPFSPTISSTSLARSWRRFFSMPCTSSPQAALSMIFLWGRSPKCWNTIATFCRRNWVSSRLLYLRTSSPSTLISPVVGSISRIRQRMRVDLPLPERPMTTNVSPRDTSKLTFCRATTQPVSSWISALVLSAYSGVMTDLGFFPNTFHSDRTDMRSPPAAASSPLVIVVMSVLMVYLLESLECDRRQLEAALLSAVLALNRMPGSMLRPGWWRWSHPLSEGATRGVSLS